MLARCGAEVALMIVENLSISQGINEGTHKGGLLIDLAGLDARSSPAFMPFSGIVKLADPRPGHAVVVESLAPVLQPGADGKPVLDFLHIRAVHDDVLDVKPGQTLQQGQKFYDEGRSGKATGNHIHLAVGRGKYEGEVLTSAGYYKLKNEIAPWEGLFVNDTILRKPYGYPWKEASAMPSLIYPTSVATITAAVLQYRDKPTLTGKALGILPKGGTFPILSETLADGYRWAELAFENQIVYAAMSSKQGAPWMTIATPTAIPTLDITQEGMRIRIDPAPAK